MRWLLLCALIVVTRCARLAEYGDPRLRPEAPTAATPAATSATTPATTRADALVVRNKGTVRRLDQDGGFWGVRADDGRRYRVTDLPPVYQKDGTRIRFVGRVQDSVDLASWGTVLELTEVSGV
jgi:hypothetical protein